MFAPVGRKRDAGGLEHRTALAVEDHRQHHLPQVRAVVLGMAVRPQALPTRAVERHLPGKATDRGVTAADNRLFLEAVLWRVRAGSPWRDLPPAFGNWNSVFQRFRRWAKKGVFERLFEELSAEPDFEYALIDATIVSVHQKASGAKGGLKIRPSADHGAD